MSNATAKKTNPANIRTGKNQSQRCGRAELSLCYVKQNQDVVSSFEYFEYILHENLNK